MKSMNYFHPYHPNVRGVTALPPAHAPRLTYGHPGYHLQHPASIRYAPLLSAEFQLHRMMPDVGSKIHQPGWTHQTIWPEQDGMSFAVEQRSDQVPFPLDCRCAECEIRADAGMREYINVTPHPQEPPHYSQTPAPSYQQTAQSFLYVPIQNHCQQALQLIEAPPQCYRLLVPCNQVFPAQGLPSETSSSLSVVDPQDIFPQSPVPTLSNCSTRSISSEFSRFTHIEVDDHLIYDDNPDYSEASSTDLSTIDNNQRQYIRDTRRIRELTRDTSVATAHNLSTSPSTSPSPSADNESSYSSNLSRSPTPDTGCQQRRSALAASRRKEQLARRAKDSRCKDDLLVQWKHEGLSYREIKERGKFTEAESTLRGRYRSLTKAAEQRVRRPRWTKRDIILLNRAVNHLSNAMQSTCARGAPSTRRCHRSGSRKEVIKLKTPWKEVAQYIVDNGGSYHFGNATCRKKWDEVQAREQARGRSSYEDQNGEEDGSGSGFDQGEEDEEDCAECEAEDESGD